MFINPLSPITFLKISSLKSTVILLSILLFKTNLLRLKGGLVGGLVALILVSGLLVTSSIAVGSLVYAFKLKNEQKTNNDLEVEDKLEAVNI